MIKASKFDLIFHHKEKAAKDAFSFYFERPKDFNFDPGQYLKITQEIENPDARGSSRYFTISSSPTDKDFLTITTRIIKSSFKLALADLKPGQKISAFGPIGYFDFYPKNKTQNIFLAGGMGITPFHSILRYIDANQIKSKIILIASFQNRQEAVFYNEIKGIEKKNSAIKIIYSLTNEKKLSSDFEKGRIDENMIKKYVQNYSSSHFFIVGPPAMVESMFEIVVKLGISEEKIFKEDFSGY